jgi:hypothetical protein
MIDVRVVTESEDGVALSRTTEITALHEEIAGHLRTSLEKAIRIGQLLCEQKSSLKHGEFGEWIKVSLPFTDRTARNYMRLYECRDQLKTETVSDLSLTQGYRLLTDGRRSAFDDALHSIRLASEQLEALDKRYRNQEGHPSASDFASGAEATRASWESARDASRDFFEEARPILDDPTVTIEQLVAFVRQCDELQQQWQGATRLSECILGRILNSMEATSKG